MFKLILLTVTFISISSLAQCPDLRGTWEGPCNRDGVTKTESMIIRQESCRHINMYRVDYKIGRPYEQRHENAYEKMINVFNFRWGSDGSSLYFDVDRIRWMKYKNIVSTGDGKGIIKLDGDEMDYSRTYSSRDRKGINTTKKRKCKLRRI